MKSGKPKAESRMSKIPFPLLPCRSAPLPLRKGISLLEVLMSIFIITIGVLGVAALLPLATHLANRGTTADRAAIAGREAMNQIIIREMNNPANWLPSNGIDPDLNDDNVPFSLDPTVAASPLHPLGAKAFCLDPRGIAHGVTGNFPVGGTANMPRITLRPQAGADLSALTPAQKQVWADELCRLQDDLYFDVPDDPNLLPVSKMFTHDNGTPGNTAADKADDVPIKRYSDGDFSWLATIVREQNSGMYTLSIVVFNKRNTPQAADENLMTTVFLSGGYGGGDIRITGAAAEFAVPGQWIMLAAGNRFRWYRIVNASDYVPGTTSREVTVVGRDWDTVAAPTPEATLVSGTIAVYERTMRLEASSLWQN